MKLRRAQASEVTAYRVVITPNAEQDLRHAYRYIRNEAPEAARRWVTGAMTKIKSLKNHPSRCPLAPEADSANEPIRELFYGTGNRATYRILFVILAETVYVLHVRHGSMDQL